MDPGSAGREFAAYGLSHWLVLGLFATGSAALVICGRKHRDSGANRLFTRAFAVVLLGLQLGMQVHALTPARWNIEGSLPLHLSDLAGLATAYALWSRRRWAFALTYYWGLALSTQALVAPVLQGPDFPHPGFLVFWGTHLLVVWAAIYLTWGLGFRPTWHSYRVAVAITSCWAIAAFVFNTLTGTNYGFLNRKPETGSLLDVLGPWPWYLIPEITLILGAWALMTLPWTRCTTAVQT
ncbi:TIGR02206 family membrane protein [Amycolatopsis tucumanensis]|uniref:TIGR02206 family membrane protein n=1 Tax=Amycolatopsis tucumanensis TaxID=401106 RepID=A0ABP7JPG5_9PSEU|nr:TIGR02206 family membrane protein [Amycolatopsis tucumanensis]MCF6425008.1 TIGR02206 family membrane protein [Amycolatopsis tucumanensis]